MKKRHGPAPQRQHPCKSLSIAALQLRTRLLRWYAKHGRHDLPWRRTRDPYAILVSEFMLQQTQVATVLPYYEKWIRRFPTFSALAAASQSDVLHAWQGLGYYSRARNLHTTAKLVQKRYRGVLPADPGLLQELPGIGRYTANAIATFAFDQSVPVVEANTSRALSRLFDITAHQELWNAAAALVPNRRAGCFNSALMDLGALICTARQPICRACPVKAFCRAPTLQLRKRRSPTTHLREDHVFVANGDRILLERCRTRWKGMWMLPARKLDPFNRLSLTRSKVVYRARFPFTHHRVTLRVFCGSGGESENANQRWVPRSALASIPLPSPHHRAIEALLS